MSSSEEAAQPPEAPEIERRFRLQQAQWVGIPVLVLIPILAIAGVFGDRLETVSVATADLTVEMTYPTRQRHWTLNSIHFEVTNRSDGVLDTVRIAVDTAYAAHFSAVSGIPPFKHPYLMELTGLEPGDSRRARFEMQANRYGRHAGEVRVTTAGTDTLRLRISSFTFP